jgi:signal transduction histidine kinase
MSRETDLQEKLAGLDEDRKGTREHVDLLNKLAGDIVFTQPARSFELAGQAEGLSRGLDYGKGVAESQCNQAYHHYQAGRHQEALEMSGKALDFFLEVDDRRGQGDVFGCLGLVYWSLGDYEKAVRYGQQSLKLFEATESRYGAGWVLTALGGVYHDTGDYEQALALHARSLAIFRELGDPLGEGRALTGMGTVYQTQGKHDLALEQHLRSLELFRSIGNKLSESRALNDIGALYQATGELEKAFEYHLEALRLRQEAGNQQAETTSLINLGRLYNQKQDPERALEHLHRALTLTVAMSARPKIYQVHEALSQSYALLGRHQLALEHHREFHRVKEQVAGEESSTRLKNLEISHGVEKAEKEAEIERLRNVELAQALERLTVTQAQLVHSAKMASLGDLVAGLVHEIATPIGAIQASADVAQRTLKKADSAAATQDKVRILQSLDLNHRTILTAGERLARLIRSLKSYAQLDESEFQLANIEHGIEATLDLIAPKLGDRVEAVKDFGEVPSVECYPSQLYQAFMTILVNAVESIEGRGVVTVKTWTDNGGVSVRIADTGRGIPRDQLDKIFEVGFSEKHSRMRMHVGLSNVQTIVQKHGGSVAVESEVGKGTAFTIRLPRDQSSSRRAGRVATPNA